MSSPAQAADDILRDPANYTIEDLRKVLEALYAENANLNQQAANNSKRITALQTMDRDAYNV